MSGVVAITAVLVTFSPPQALAGSGIVSQTASLADGSIDITVDPAKPGRNAVHVYVFGANGQLQPSSGASLSSTLASRDIGPFATTMRAAGPGHFVATGVTFPIAGSWSVRLAVRSGDFDEQTHEFTIPIRTGG